ncbi:MAG: ComEA family DNA-binding protein [bacterium]|nr:ComEA family DNA-binding protein [bacterium]
MKRRVNINRAAAVVLEQLPLIGPKRAARIVADRRARGPFGSVDDLDRVPGIGPRIVARLRPHVTV